MSRILIVLGGLLLLSACETATPYQPITPAHAQASGGYSEQQIEGDRWRIDFAGNSLTSRQTVERYLLFRAAQLTLKQGCDWFETADRHTDKSTSYDGDPILAGWGGPYWGFYEPGYGWGYGYWGGPFDGWGGGPSDITAVTRYTATVEIIIGRGPKPNALRAYDAHEVVRYLQPTIIYPKTGD